MTDPVEFVAGYTGDRPITITLEFDVTAVCPWDDEPTDYIGEVEYVTGGPMIEAYQFEEWLGRFDDEVYSQEDLTDEIQQVVTDVLNLDECTTTLHGGHTDAISITTSVDD